MTAHQDSSVATPTDAATVPTVGKPLPIPPLDDTLERILTATQAVNDEDTVAQTRRAIDDFRQGVGPQLQEKLEDFAQQQAHSGSSWLAEQWLGDYLATRTPLPLTSNVGFQLNLPTPSQCPPQRRAAALIAAIAELHLQQARGTQPEEVDARGNHMSPWQWECFNGGVRHPAEGSDRIRRSEKGAADREIGVLINGRMFALRVSDTEGRSRTVAELDADIQRLLSYAQREGEPAQSFVAPTYQDSEEVAAFLDSVLIHSKNAMTYHRLVDFLCVVHLTDPEVGGIEAEAQALHDCAFAPDHAWTLKPITYEIGLSSSWACLHVEHSTVDGATLVTAVSRIQQNLDDLTAARLGADDSDGAEDTNSADTVELQWIDPPCVDLQQYRQSAKRLRVNIVRATKPTSTSMKVSADAASQLIMSIAQQLTYQKIRAVYEAVDMREYVAGRTECLRAVTSEAVALAQSVVADESIEQIQPKLQSALDAHRAWVKRCKTGNGFDRHFWALGFTAQRVGVAAPEFFKDAGIIAARSDFLSTTSIGSDAQIVRYTFAPTLPHGFGVNYTPLADEIEFCLSWWDDSAEQSEEFTENLVRAAQMLADVIAKADSAA